VEKTKVTADTTDLFRIVRGNPATPALQVAAAHDRLIEVLQRFFGGEAIPLHRP
jgi:DNA/RNA-binding domain of Phe-tRNA-synthetase-like protein